MVEEVGGQLRSLKVDARRSGQRMHSAVSPEIQKYERSWAQG